MGGDTDSTEGAEPSHMHAGFQDANYQRGYEWWLMKEAKARKPSLKLYGLPWGFPGWLDPTASPTKEAKNPFTNATITANYTLAFLENAKKIHNLDMDYMGQWNERDAPADYNQALRQAVSESAVVQNTTVLNRLPHYPGTGTSNANCSQKIWNTTDGSHWVDEEGSIFDGRSARCLARCLNRQYVTGCHTATFQWHLISSFYDYLPWSRCGVAGKFLFFFGVVFMCWLSSLLLLLLDVVVKYFIFSFLFLSLTFFNLVSLISFLQSLSPSISSSLIFSFISS